MIFGIFSVSMQVRQETRVSGNYTASVRVVTASPGGFSGDPAQKLRAVLVRACASTTLRQHVGASSALQCRAPGNDDV